MVRFQVALFFFFALFCPSDSKRRLGDDYDCPDPVSKGNALLEAVVAACNGVPESGTPPSTNTHTLCEKSCNDAVLEYGQAYNKYGTACTPVRLVSCYFILYIVLVVSLP